MRKVAGTALAGTSIEWYDFFIYGTAAALVFPTAFFPEDMPVMVALIASFSTFAVGLLHGHWVVLFLVTTVTGSVGRKRWLSHF